MSNVEDDGLHTLKITYVVKIKKWRIDEPKDSDWSLAVYDKVLDQWVNLSFCARPGEDYYIESIEEI